MSRYQLTLTADRSIAMQAIREAPDGARLTIKTARRSTDQNARMWAMLTDVAMQLEWHGQKLSTNDWKLLFLDLLRRELRLVPNLDKTGWVNLGRSSSDLSKAEMGDLMELIAAFGAQHGVTFRDEAA
jgi:hypothetical protein